MLGLLAIFVIFFSLSFSFFFVFIPVLVLVLVSMALQLLGGIQLLSIVSNLDVGEIFGGIEEICQACAQGWVCGDVFFRHVFLTSLSAHDCPLFICIVFR